MNSKDKGNIGQALALAEFTKRGIQTSIPFGDNARYDLIAEFNDKLNKIQVKYCNQQIINGSILCPCASSTNHTTNKNRTTYQNEIDYFVFYLVKWDKLIIVPIEDIQGKKSLCFRLTPPSVKTQYHLVQDYLFSTFFKDRNKEDKAQKELLQNKNFCIECGVEISKKASRCRSCAAKNQERKVEVRPSRQQLKSLIRSTPFTKIAKNYDVSDNTIRKWCNSEDLPRTKKEIQSYSDQEWENI